MFVWRHGYVHMETRFFLGTGCSKADTGCLYGDSMFILRHTVFKSRHGMFIWR